MKLQRRRRHAARPAGSAVVVVLVLIALATALATVNATSLRRLSGELRRLELRQQRHWSGATNTPPAVPAPGAPEPAP